MEPSNDVRTMVYWRCSSACLSQSVLRFRRWPLLYTHILLIVSTLDGHIRVETYNIASSVAFPMVILSRAPAVSPKKLAASSVARQSISARGMIARQLSTNIAESPQPTSGAMIPIGTNIRSKLFQFFISHAPAERNVFLTFAARSSQDIGSVKSALL